MPQAKINSPKNDATDYAYQAECRMALAPSFSKLIEEAVKSGWPRQQVAYGLMVMAARELSAMEHQDLSNAIEPPIKTDGTANGTQ